MNKAKRKLFGNWKKYVLEFLMLFLAVFLGFFADNYRDEISEKSREKEYVRSLIEDVKTDKTTIDNVIKNNISRKSYLDTLSNICFNFDSKENSNQKLYKFYPIVIIRPDFFIPNELTMLQLKNAGGMRLIHNKTTIKEILRYDLQKTLVSNQQKYYENYHNNVINLGLKIFNHKQVREMIDLYKSKDTSKLKTLEYELIQTDKKIIAQFGNEVDMYGRIVDYYKRLLEETNKQADSLIVKLKEEYKIE